MYLVPQRATFKISYWGGAGRNKSQRATCLGALCYIVFTGTGDKEHNEEQKQEEGEEQDKEQNKDEDEKQDEEQNDKARTSTRNVLQRLR